MEDLLGLARLPKMPMNLVERSTGQQVERLKRERERERERERDAARL